MKCGANACAEGRYEIVKFGTLSLFDSSDKLATAYKDGKKVWAAAPPTGSIFYGEWPHLFDRQSICAVNGRSL